MPSKSQSYHFITVQYSDLTSLHHFLVPIHSCSTPLQRTPRSDKHVRAMMTHPSILSALTATLCNSFFFHVRNQSAMKRGVAAYTLTTSSKRRPLTGCPLLASASQDVRTTSARTIPYHSSHRADIDTDDDTPLADGCQALKYSYDEFTYLRSSVDIPLA
jgi:hypothetical protein